MENLSRSFCLREFIIFCAGLVSNQFLILINTFTFRWLLLAIQFNSGIDYLKKLELINLELELKFPTNNLNPQINL